MPQHTRFPYLRSGDASATVADLVRACRRVPESGMPYKEFRGLLREQKLWDKDRYRDLLAFLKLAEGAVVERSGVIGALCASTGTDGREVLAERLWTVNPMLFKGVIDCLSERVYHRDEVYLFLESAAYRGERLSRPALEDWFRLARGLEVIRPVGVGVALGDQSGPFVERAAQFDIEEFLAEDEPEANAAVPTAVGEDEGERGGADVPVAIIDDAAPAQVRPAPTSRMALPAVSAYAGLVSPFDGARDVPVSRFGGGDGFSSDTLDETSGLMTTWWQSVRDPIAPLGPSDFGIENELWIEQPEQVVYRLAVAAALVFRLEVTAKAAAAAFVALDQAGVLTDLYDGTVPATLPDALDPRALMLASLAARRCAEFGDLPAQLDGCKSAAEAFAALEGALGHGLFRIELFWIMRQLATLGVARWDDTAQFTTLPTRRVRDVLFRLGFLDSPYAADTAALSKAAAAAGRAIGGDRVDAARDHALEAFAAAAGCEYGCARRRSCPVACRERLEPI